MGAGLLWFGWFGFNAGSALAANGLTVHALVTTHVSAATAMFSWLAIENHVTGLHPCLVVQPVCGRSGCNHIWSRFCFNLECYPYSYW
ncbi:MAG: hypothetical protein ACLS36_02330 [Streptococcus sp.]